MAPQYDVIIIGGGPAGMAAGIYAARAKLRTLIL
jgi:thioredoxin reductase (NADPH)